MECKVRTRCQKAPSQRFLKFLLTRKARLVDNEIKQMERKGFGGHYSTVVLKGTDENLKVNRPPEPYRQTQVRKLIWGCTGSSQTGSTKHIKTSNTSIPMMRKGCSDENDRASIEGADRSS